MGAVISDHVRLESKADLADCLSLVRAGSPRWCRDHDDFETVADEIIAKALAGFDPSKGRFSDRLIAPGSQSHGQVPSARPPGSRPASRHRRYRRNRRVDPGPGWRRCGRPRPSSRRRCHGGRLYRQPAQKSQRAVAGLLAQGMSQAEVSVAIGLHPRR